MLLQNDSFKINKNYSCLDFGCGSNPRPGFIGVDKFVMQGVTVVADLTHFPWPFRDSSLSALNFSHSIQYFGPFIQLVHEIARVGRHGAIIEILSPHYSNYNYFTDAMYCFPLAWRTFDFFDPDSKFKWNYYAGGIFAFEILERRISFASMQEWRPNPWKWVGIDWLANRFPRLYERCFAFVMPAQEIFFKLRLLKSDK